jgi:ornithine carbamoyltransferase
MATVSTPTTTTTPTNLLQIADLDATQFEYLLDLAADMKHTPTGWRDTFRGETVALFFEKPSTRTRVSMAAGAVRLGLEPLLLRPDELQLGRGEPIADTARVLASFVAAIAIRTFKQSELEEVAQNADVPVVNALSDTHHPVQALADLLTIRERFGSLAGRRLAYSGDGNDNVVHSLLEAGALTGLDVTVACPTDYEPRPEILAAAQQTASASGARLAVVRDPREAARGADAVYTDVWVSMGEDAQTQQRLHDLADYQVNGALMGLAAPDAIFLHCLPAHRGQEVAAEVIDGPQSAVWQQAANRLPTEQAVFYALISGDWTHRTSAADDQ